MPRLPVGAVLVALLAAALPARADTLATLGRLAGGGRSG